MLKEKVTERIGKKANDDFLDWYQGKVVEIASYFTKRIYADSQLIIKAEENVESSIENRELETVAK